MAEVLYFAKDGSYGAAEDLTILSTEHWTEDDRRTVAQSSDWARWLVAQEVHGEAVRRHLLSIVEQENDED